MAHQVIIAPDFETTQMQQLPTDWRPGVRVSVVTIKAFPLGAASVVIAVLLLGLIACSGVVGTINGAGMTGLIFGGVIAAVLAVCYAALVLAIELLLPEVETVVDWTQNTIVHRRNRSQETFPLGQLTELRI
uniref:hypothetical protein n=1 Tax=Stieleria sp. TaxID=2795976 RepID=UPI00356B263B